MIFDTQRCPAFGPRVVHVGSPFQNSSKTGWLRLSIPVYGKAFVEGCHNVGEKEKTGGSRRFALLRQKACLFKSNVFRLFCFFVYIKTKGNVFVLCLCCMAVCRPPGNIRRGESPQTAWHSALCRKMPSGMFLLFCIGLPQLESWDEKIHKKGGRLAYANPPPGKLIRNRPRLPNAAGIRALQGCPLQTAKLLRSASTSVHTEVPVSLFLQNRRRYFSASSSFFASLNSR